MSWCSIDGRVRIACMHARMMRFRCQPRWVKFTTSHHTTRYVASIKNVSTPLLLLLSSLLLIPLSLLLSLLLFFLLLLILLLLSILSFFLFSFDSQNRTWPAQHTWQEFLEGGFAHCRVRQTDARAQLVSTPPGGS